jgi:3-carboxy-cis,cis-muconate cycloisomerase
MTDLFWPGDHRAGNVMSDSAFLAAMVDVENSWLTALVESGVAPAAARTELSALVSDADVEALAAGAEADGTPVIGLVSLLRDRAGAEAARWLHRGLTSQDVVDTALMMCLRDGMSRVRDELTAQVRSLAALVETHQQSPMLARTLTQAALPSTVGARMANWLSGLLDADDTLSALPALPVQAGGAAGTLAAATELTGSADAALDLCDALASAVGLAAAPPWHTTRSAITRAGDAMVGCCDAWGHIANDIATGSRAEIGEFTEGAAGRSSTMPHKANPVLSVLIRRAALTAPGLGATLHAAAAAGVDERADGGWHAEWATLRTLTRRTVVAAGEATELIANLSIDTERAKQNLAAAGDILAEQRTMAELTGRQPHSGYTGAIDHLVDTVLQRARNHLKELT